MAKVIVTMLKFSDDEKKRLIEHEKSKQVNWFLNAKTSGGGGAAAT